MTAYSPFKLKWQKNDYNTKISFSIISYLKMFFFVHKNIMDHI